MTASDIRFEVRDDGIRLITLDRPDALNAITVAMAARIDALLTEIAADDSARCIVLTGAGDRAFSAGFDINEMAEFDAAAMRQAFVARDPLFLHIAAHPLPVIAALNGIAFGAGALIAAACDFRVAGPAAQFKVTAIRYGSANATWSLPRIVGAARAKDILMTGRVVGVEEGLRIGLYDRTTEGPARDEALRLARDIATMPTQAVRAVKTLVDRSADQMCEKAWLAEHEHVRGSLEEGGKGGPEVFDAFLSNKAQHVSLPTKVPAFRAGIPSCGQWAGAPDQLSPFAAQVRTTGMDAASLGDALAAAATLPRLNRIKQGHVDALHAIVADRVIPSAEHGGAG